jgi:BirA family biotin operon repressor/biotin-[acetyl-CoA-carboxylase] ligase
VPQLALKWPNDLVTPRGKLGGILIELLGGGRGGTLLVGYGINVGHDRAQLPVAGATSLRLERGDEDPSLAELIPRMAMAVVRELDADESPARTLERYREVAAHRPGDRLGCTLAGRRYEGRFVDFDPEGRLLLDTAEGLQALSAADVVEPWVADSQPDVPDDEGGDAGGSRGR